MSRKNRISYPGACYHIINRGNNGENIFLDDSDRIKFFQILIKYRNKFNLVIYSYALMGNHIHLFIKTEEANISSAMKMINWSYAVYFNKKYGRKGHLFQSRFTSKTVGDSRYFMSLIRYIHNNPLKAGFCEKISDYRWSAHKDYLSNNKIIINGMDEIMNLFSNNIDSYVDFMSSAVDEREYKILNRIRNEDLSLMISKVKGEKIKIDIRLRINNLVKLDSISEKMMSDIMEESNVSS
ncbi:MAG: transposase [Elusimicrobia bacterium]|nr:transposase [Elusimicrobiota bacterium]